MTTATSTTTASGKTKEVLVGLLGNFIADQSLKPGDRLPSIRDLASHFGVKSGVVRDALLDAQGKGIIKLLPRAGAFVQATSSASDDSTPPERMGARLHELMAAQNQNMFHLIAVREMLELELISLAIRKCELQDLFPLRRILENMASMVPDQRNNRYVELDIDFHLEIARLSGNAVMAAMLRTLLEELEPHLLEICWSPGRHEQTDKSHASLYAAIAASNVEVAQDEVRAHLKVAYDTLLKQVRKPPEM